MKTNFLIAAGLIVWGQFALAQTPVSKAKIAELSAHRIDRLVSLKKIDASFLRSLERIDVVVLGQTPAFYQVRVSQGRPSQGSPLQADLIFDKAGKPLSYQVLPDGNPGPDGGWSGKDAVSLVEHALHYVLENANNPKLQPFNTGLTSLTLSPESLSGKPVARGQITSSETTNKLNIYLKLDGSFISSEVIP